jgi:hypothetical protein
VLYPVLDRNGLITYRYMSPGSDIRPVALTVATRDEAEGWQWQLERRRQAEEAYQNMRHAVRARQQPQLQQLRDNMAYNDWRHEEWRAQRSWEREEAQRVNQQQERQKREQERRNAQAALSPQQVAEQIDQAIQGLSRSVSPWR